MINESLCRSPGQISTSPTPESSSSPAASGSMIYSIANITNTPLDLNEHSEEAIAAGFMLPEITNSNVVAYLRDNKRNEIHPRVYVAVDFTAELFTEPVIFFNDIFINCLGGENPHFISGCKLINCTFMTEMTREMCGRTYRLRDLSDCWVETLFEADAGHFAANRFNIDLSGIDMSKGGLLNVALSNAGNLKLEGSSFRAAFFDNVCISAITNQHSDCYQINSIDFSYLQAGKWVLHDVAFNQVNCSNMQVDLLELVNVRFENVNFDNVIIKELLMFNKVDFSGVVFGNYKLGNIKLCDENFCSEKAIHAALNSLLNAQTGADLFNSIETINHRVVRIDLLQQLVNYCRHAQLLSCQLDCHPSLRLSIMNGLKNYAAESVIIREFLQECLPELGGRVLPAIVAQNRELSQLLTSVLTDIIDNDDNRFHCQFLLHQLVETQPCLRDVWLRNRLLRHISLELSKLLLVNIEEVVQNRLFYSPDNKRALYLTTEDFWRLIHSHQIPAAFANLAYHPDGSVVVLPSLWISLNPTLCSLPTLHRQWSYNGRLIETLIASMFADEGQFSDPQKLRAELIKEHVISLLLHITWQKMELVEISDINILDAMLSPYYRGEDAAQCRHQLIGNMSDALRQQLLNRGLTGNKLMSVVALMLARILTDLSSSVYCGTEEDSPLPLRLLAAALIADCQAYRKLVNQDDAELWREILIPASKETFTCTFVLSRRMAEFKPAAVQVLRG